MLSVMNACAQSPYEQNMHETLVGVVRTRAQFQPTENAYTYLTDDGEVALTYSELDRRARAVAAAIQRCAPVGARALLVYPAGVEFIVAYFGCQYAGVIAVPTAAPRFGKEDQVLGRLQAIARNSEAVLLLGTAATLASLAQFSEWWSMQRLATDQIEADLACDWDMPEIGPLTAAYLQYSSGSTGVPKGVVVTHRNVLANLALICRAFGVDNNSSGVSWLPTHHDMGLVGSIILPMYAGRPMLLLSPIAFLQRPVRWLQAISDRKATISGGPNFAFELCVRRVTEEQCAGLDLSRWTVAYTGAEPIRPDTLERFATKFKACGFRPEAFLPCYGLAEATLMVSGGPTGVAPRIRTLDPDALSRNYVALPTGPDAPARQVASSGRTWNGSTVVIVNPRTNVRCAPNEVGEIWVSGASVGEGYWQQGSETATSFVARTSDTNEGPFLRTGDLGFLLDGDLYVTGRLKDVVIVNGENRYPQDIERTAELSHPALRQGGSACFAIDQGHREQIVVAAEVDRHYRRELAARHRGEDTQLDLECIRKAVRQAVTAEHGLQVHAVVLLAHGSLPMTSSGKIQRHACRAAYAAGTLSELEK
jgi:acyl-CoA synthetase (AMP-forming)/AMP-acid ligase II